MRKDIIIGDQSVEVNTSAGWLFVYREQFGRDVLSDVVPLLDAFAGASTDFAKAIYKGKTEKEIKSIEEVNVFEVLQTIDPDTLQELIYKAASVESVTIMKILWAMAKNAGGSIPAPIEWANSFEKMPLDEVIPELADSIMEALASTKKYQSLRTMLQKILSRSPHSQSEESQEGLLSKA